MLTWEVHTLGGGEALVKIFNGIAAMMGGSFFLSMIKVSALLGLLWVLIEVSFSQQFSRGPKWLLGFVLIFNLAFVPKVSLVIHDDIEQSYVGKVDNVPMLLGLLVGLKSQLEIGLTRAAETAFSPVDDLKYSHSGMLMGGKLIDMAQKAQIMDHHLLESVSHFMYQCVFYDMKLHFYTLAELNDAEDLFKFIGERTAINRSFRYWDVGGRRWEIKECKIGCPLLSQQIEKEVNKNAAILGKKLFPKASLQNAQRLFLNRLPQAYDSLFKAGSRDASALLKQSIMINAFKGAQEHRFQGQYAAARANIQAKMAYLATKRQAETWVAVLKTVLEALFYGSFPLIFLLALLPIGYQILTKYIEVMIWLASWGPLYAILNMIMSGNLGTTTQAAATLLDGSVAVTLGTQGGIEAVYHDIALLAGYLSLSIPFIAAGLTKGVSAMSGLATSMLAVPQAAASAAASEATTGNISLGNLNMDNLSYNNESANKLQASAVMSNYGMQIQNTHGGMTNFTGKGEVRHDQTSAFSRTPAISANLDHSLANNYSSEASNSLTQGINQTHQSMEHRGEAMQIATQAALNDRVQTSSGDNYSKTLSTDQRKSLEEFNKASDAFSKETGLSRNVAGQYLIEAYAGRSTGLFKALGLEGGIKGSISNSGSIHAQRNFKVAQDFVKGKNLGKAISTTEGLMKSENFNVVNEQGESMNDSINRHLDQSTQLSRHSQTNLGQANNLAERAQHVQSHTESTRSDLTQPFVDYMRDEKGLSNHRIQELLSGGGVGNHQKLLGHYRSFSESSLYFGDTGKKAYANQAQNTGIITTEQDLSKQHNTVLNQPATVGGLGIKGSSFNEGWGERQIENPEVLTKRYNTQKTQSMNDQSNLKKINNEITEQAKIEGGYPFAGTTEHSNLVNEIRSGIQSNQDRMAQTEIDSNKTEKEVVDRGIVNDRNLGKMLFKEIPVIREFVDLRNKNKDEHMEQHKNNLENSRQRAKESLQNQEIRDKKFVPVALRKETEPGIQIRNLPLTSKQEDESS